MEKRLILAIVLSMAVMMTWQVLFMPAPKPAAVADEPHLPAESGAVAAGTQTPGAAPGQPTAPAELPTDRQDERIVIIDTPLYRAEVTNRGGAVRSFRLKKYAQTPQGADAVEMVPQPEGLGHYFGEEYLEHDKNDILKRLPAEIDKILLPYALRIPQKEIPEGYSLGLTTFQMEAPSDAIQLDGEQTASLVFRLNTASGLGLVKTLTFHADNYLTDVKIELRNSGTTRLEFGPEMVVTEGFRRTGVPQSTQYDHSTPVYGAGGKRHIPDLPDRGTQEAARDPQMEWAAVEDLYFFSGFVPRRDAQTVLVEKTKGLGLLRVLVRFDPIALDPGQSETLESYGYLGPKENQRLQAIGYNLDRIIDYGMFRFLALPAVAILKFIENLTGSYGLAIIALTVLLKLVTYPLTNAQMRSMEKMKALAPELEKLKAKYKEGKDPERFNQEMMGLYRRHGVNPAAGCLPILVQMPIFLALYSALLYSISLRHTPFLYIPDLSNPDPYYLSPLLMGASMVLQMRMSPAPPDPAQATMMKIMPIMFTGLFLFAPAGLVVYWLMNNVLSIGQQLLLQKKAAKS